MTINPVWIRRFVVVAEERSFSAAAARLRVAQPWLSVQIRKLEKELGFPLFRRTSRHVELTENGQALLLEASEFLKASENLDAAIRALQHTQQQQLRIGIPPYGTLFGVYREMVERFSRAHPEVTVEVEYGWTPQLLERLDHGGIDLAFALGAAQRADLLVQSLAPVERLLLLPEDHILASLERVPVTALADCRIAVFPRALNPGLYDELYTPLLRQGATPVPVPHWDRKALRRYLVQDGLLWIGLGDSRRVGHVFGGLGVTGRALEGDLDAISFSIILPRRRHAGPLRDFVHVNRSRLRALMDTGLAG
ncbi:MAG: LysR family transcriptional regulator [Ectothiorhodospiraceae bacterium]|nr:LysR family transcriptional regulator [Ectothiorhodospiraceae bacterium]